MKMEIYESPSSLIQTSVKPLQQLFPTATEDSLMTRSRTCTGENTENTGEFNGEESFKVKVNSKWTVLEWSIHSLQSETLPFIQSELKVNCIHSLQSIHSIHLIHFQFNLIHIFHFFPHFIHFILFLTRYFPLMLFTRAHVNAVLSSKL